MNNLEKVIQFLHAIGDLKATLRWPTLPNGRQESTADHSWRLAMMTVVFAEELKLDIDVLKAVKIALVHDLAEAITGDFTSWDVAQGKVSKAHKQQLEVKAIEHFRDLLPTDLGHEIMALWQEYEECTTPEGRYIKALDKMEFYLQFNETGYTMMDDAIDHTALYGNEQVKKLPSLKAAFAILKREMKEEYKKGGWEWKQEYDDFD